MIELTINGAKVNGPDVNDTESMKEYRKRFSKEGFSKEIKICRWQIASYKYIQKYKEKKPSKFLSFLDVGGRKGEYSDFATGFSKYDIMEIDEGVKGENIIHGDISSCKNISDSSYDIVFSRDVFEHIKEPWRAAEECLRITKPGGLNIHVTLFAWRWHPVPVDMYRYTHQGLSFLFERTHKIKTLFAGYDLVARRSDLKGGKMKNKIDAVPLDEMGGFRENQRVVYVGKKND